MAATPRTATLSGTPAWTNGNPFDGYVLIGLSLPTGYTAASPIGQWPNVSIPLWTKCNIQSGVFNGAVSLYYSSDIEPPNTQYVAYWYDNQNTQISGASSLFTIGASPFAITIPTLTAPSVSGSTPTPPTLPT